MKFLRKIGRKIKKGLGKIMGSKIGRVVGFIGLAMAMGAAAKALMAGMEGAAATGAVVGEGVGGAVVGGVAEGATAAGLIEGTVATEAISAPLIEEITVSAAKKAGAGQISNTLSIIEKAPTTTEAVAEAFNAIESNTVASIDGINYVNPDMATVNSSITESINHQLETTFNPNYQPSTYDTVESFEGFGSKYDGALGTKPSLTESGINVYDTEYLEGLTTPIKSPTTAFDTSFADVSPATMEIDPNSLLVDRGAIDISVPEIPTAEPFGERAQRWVREQFPETPGEFVADVGKGVVTGELMGMIAGEPKEQFYSKGVSPRLESVGPQDAYLNAIGPSFKVATNTNIIPTLEKLKNANLPGTGSKQWLDMFGQQPMMFPSTIGLPQPSGGGSFRYG